MYVCHTPSRVHARVLTGAEALLRSFALLFPLLIGHRKLENDQTGKLMRWGGLN